MTVAHYLQGLVPHAMPADSTLDVIQGLFREVPTLGESVIGLTVITAVALWLAVRAVTNREYVLDQ